MSVSQASWPAPFPSSVCLLRRSQHACMCLGYQVLCDQLLSHPDSFDQMSAMPKLPTCTHSPGLLIQSIINWLYQLQQQFCFVLTHILPETGSDSQLCLSTAGDLMGFIGALGTGPTTFWLPSVIWLVLKKPGMGNWHFWACWICIILGVIVTIVGSIGGLRGIISDASTYKIYQ